MLHITSPEIAVKQKGNEVNFDDKDIIVKRISQVPRIHTNSYMNDA